MKGGFGRRSLLVAALSGCSFGGSGGGCSSANGTLGKASFGYVCPCSAPPTGDAWCDTSTPDGIPAVATGATFELSTTAAAGPRPLDPAAAISSSAGWTLPRPGWVAFGVSQGSNILDFVQVRGRSVAFLELSAGVLPIVEVGGPAIIAATLLADDGTVLAGAIPCTFRSSDPALATVTGQGRLGTVLASAVGDVTIAATCLGQTAQILIHVVPSPDAGSDDAADDTSTEARADSDVTDASGGSDAGEDSAAVGAEPLDAASLADGEGG